MLRTKLLSPVWGVLVALLTLFCLQMCAPAAAPPPPSDTSVATTEAPAAPTTQLLTVGVLPFQSRDEQRSRELTDIMTADLSTNAALRLVERSRLDQVTGELGLSKTGVGDQETAQKVGFLAGANVLVWGRLFLIDKQAMLVARVVGVETGRVFAEQVRGADTQDLLPMVDELARKVGARILKERAALVAPDVRDDLQANLNALAETLKGKSLPKVAVLVGEQHLGAASFDPAAETELLYWLTHSKLPVVDLSSQPQQMRQWAKEYHTSSTFEVPQLVPEDVAVLLVGDALSEPAGDYGPLHTCRYRVEVRAVDRATGDVIVVARRTGTYVDASPVLAGKSAIQHAAAGIAYEIIPKLAGYVPKTRPTPPAEPAPAPTDAK
jgi:TolB-like protein